ncbi:MAG: anthranilate synthase component I family protein [Myxococcota bacterium]
MHSVVRSNLGPLAVASYLAGRDADGLIFFDSGTRADSGDWSIITCAPECVLVGRGAEFFETESGDAVEDAAHWLLARESKMQQAEVDDLPFVGGLAGFLGFEFGHQLDDVRATPRPRRVPDIWVGDYPGAALYEHETGKWHLIGEPSRCLKLLQAALDEAAVAGPEALPAALSGRVRHTVAREAYVRRAQASIDAIYAGETFEINYTERFEADWPGSPFELYRRLRATSSARFGGYLNAGDTQILSASPEQFVRVDEGHVMTRPIKGTRGRGRDAAEDRRLADELLASEKDRAENIMIVDLMRNDLTRVCELGSVRATALCELETFNGVHHLVSTVEGTLDDSLSPLSVLLSSFPAGSITGAPKLRAIELITELEETPRGPYTGSMFYASRHGRMDSNVLIRTATISDGVARYGAGGAVVAQSQPEAEYEEALVKAAPFFEAVEG